MPEGQDNIERRPQQEDKNTEQHSVDKPSITTKPNTSEMPRRRD